MSALSHHQYKSQKAKWKLIQGFLTLAIILAALVGSVLSASKIQEFLTRATAEPANIVVNAQANLGYFEKPWRNLAQGGEDHAWRLHPLASQVKTLHPEYIRIDHVFDFYDIVSGSSGNLSYDYSKLDALIDDILATGAKPYIVLSYMPSAITQGDIVSPPGRFEDWQLVVQKLIEHVSGTRGIEDVYYEVWNEPDLFGNWKYSGERNYLTLYTYAAQGAVSARGVKSFKIGGPATTGLYKNWFDALAQHVIANHLRLDFFSWHRYSADVNRYRRDMIQARGWLKNYPQLEPSLEFHITEWGSDSDVNPVYDTSYAAAHTAATAIEMVGIVQRAFVFEIQDGKSPNGQVRWGRWGMFTHQDFGAQAKPRFRALQLLEKLGDERLVLLGKGTYVKAMATKSPQNDTIQIALANFDAWGKNSEVVPVAVLDLPLGTYTIVTTFLTKSAVTQTVSVQGALNFTVPLGPQEVAVVEIKKTN